MSSISLITTAKVINKYYFHSFSPIIFQIISTSTNKNGRAMSIKTQLLSDCPK